MAATKLNVIVTSFGPFMTITDNPSDEVRKVVLQKFGSSLQVLAADQAHNIELLHSECLAVEDDVCVDFLRKAKELISRHRREHPNEEYLVLHLGVHGGMRELQVNLERRCFNGRCFEGKNSYRPGFLGRVSNLSPIDEVQRTLAPINHIKARLEAAHPFVEISDNPGRYLCNYI